MIFGVEMNTWANVREHSSSLLPQIQAKTPTFDKIQKAEGHSSEIENSHSPSRKIWILLWRFFPQDKEE